MNSTLKAQQLTCEKSCSPRWPTLRLHLRQSRMYLRQAHLCLLTGIFETLVITLAFKLGELRVQSGFFL